MKNKKRILIFIGLVILLVVGYLFYGQRYLPLPINFTNSDYNLRIAQENIGPTGIVSYDTKKGRIYASLCDYGVYCPGMSCLDGGTTYFNSVGKLLENCGVFKPIDQKNIQRCKQIDSLIKDLKPDHILCPIIPR